MSDESLRPEVPDVNPFKMPIRYLGEVSTPAELVDALRSAHLASLQAAEHGLDVDDRFVVTGER